MKFVLYRAPYTLALYVMHVADEHVPTLEDRMSRGAFSPRTLFEARRDVWVFIPTHREPVDAPGNPYEWEVRDALET